MLPLLFQLVLFALNVCYLGLESFVASVYFAIKASAGPCGEVLPRGQYVSVAGQSWWSHIGEGLVLRPQQIFLQSLDL